MGRKIRKTEICQEGFVMKKQKGGFRKIIGVSMACCMLTNLAVPVSFAEEIMVISVD